MKTIAFIACVFISFAVTAQKNSSIDTRLLVDKNIAAKAEENFKTNPGAYDQMLFELDNGWFTQSTESLNERQKAQLLSIDGIVSADGKPFDPSVLSNPAYFNFYAYNFQRHETKTVAYDLGNGTVLVFYSAEKLRLMNSQN